MSCKCAVEHLLASLVKLLRFSGNFQYERRHAVGNSDICAHSGSFSLPELGRRPKAAVDLCALGINNLLYAVPHNRS